MLLYSARYFQTATRASAGTRVADRLRRAMLGLVWADNLILLVIFWELTGILSYL